MKKLLGFVSVALLSLNTLLAQSPVAPILSADQFPGLIPDNTSQPLQTPWQNLFIYDITDSGAGISNAGVVLADQEIWVSKWTGPTISRFSLGGSLLGQFVVPGVSAIRSMTTDGSFIYAADNTSSIFKIDPVTQTLVSTITVGAVPNIRYCTYDPTVNSGTGGFWVGTWATDFVQVDLTGSVQNGISASSHLLYATYGLAFDNISAGGPYLWAFHQTMTNYYADIIQININTGTQTGVIHDVSADLGLQNAVGGGLFLQSSPLALIGVLQAGTVPNDHLFAYDIAGIIGINDHIAPTEMISAFPNPANESVNIRIKRENNDAMQIRIIDVLGHVVASSNNVGMNNYFNIAGFEAGVYFAEVLHNGKMYTTKIVKN